MSNIFKNFLNSMKLTEDEDDEYEDYLYEESEKELKRAKRLEKKEAKNARYEEEQQKQPAVSQVTQAAASPVSADFKKERVSKMERSTASKVVPIRTTPKGLEVCIMKPTTFEDSQEICDMLLTGRATVINLEGFDVELAQRIMDFISGSVYAMNGKLHQISSYIFIISPDTVDISGDYLDLIPDAGFEVPTLNKEF